jgi:hypothetical protein
MYFFPRECPRILLWRKEGTRGEDVERWWAGSAARMLAFIEESWAERHAAAALWRYELPSETFEYLGEIGHYVSRTTVRPVATEPFGDLRKRLGEAEVELRVLPSLLPLRGVWDSTLHASGIRLRNAQGWVGAP